MSSYAVQKLVRDRWMSGDTLADALACFSEEDHDATLCAVTFDGRPLTLASLGELRAAVARRITVTGNVTE